MFDVRRYEDGFSRGVVARFDTEAEAEAYVAEQKTGRITTITGSQGRTVYYTVTKVQA